MGSTWNNIIKFIQFCIIGVMGSSYIVILTSSIKVNDGIELAFFAGFFIYMVLTSILLVDIKEDIKDNPDFNSVPKGIKLLSKEEMNQALFNTTEEEVHQKVKIYVDDAKLELKEKVKNIQFKHTPELAKEIFIPFSPFDLSPEQEVKLTTWKNNLPKFKETRKVSRINYKYIYSTSGIGISLVVKRSDGHKIDLTEYELW